MSATIKLQITDEASPKLAQVLNGLKDRTRLNSSIATKAEDLTRNYLIGIAGSRHKTANRLGATPSGFLSDAAESVTAEHDADAAIVSIDSPGMGRAFSDVTILPGSGKKYLTIPATAAAYNKRAGEFSDLRLAFFKSKGGSSLLALVKKADEPKGRSKVFYWLKRSVTQKQDRTLLPSDQEFLAAAEAGAEEYIKPLIETRDQTNIL